MTGIIHGKPHQPVYKGVVDKTISGYEYIREIKTEGAGENHETAGIRKILVVSEYRPCSRHHDRNNYYIKEHRNFHGSQVRFEPDINRDADDECSDGSKKCILADSSEPGKTETIKDMAQQKGDESD